MTESEFIKREIATWGEEEIEWLLERGYTPKLLYTDTGDTRWTWILPFTSLDIPSRV